MPKGFARIVRIGSLSPPNNYGYTWKDSDSQEDVDNFVAGKSLAAAYSEVGALFQALSGTVREARITVNTGINSFGEIWRTVTNGNYAYRWKTTGPNYATTVTGKSLAAAYNEIGALVSGTVVFAEIEGEST